MNKKTIWQTLLLVMLLIFISSIAVASSIEVVESLDWASPSLIQLGRQHWIFLEVTKTPQDRYYPSGQETYGYGIHLPSAQATIIRDGQTYSLNSVQLSFQSTAMNSWSVSAYDNYVFGGNEGTSASFTATYDIFFSDKPHTILKHAEDSWNGSVYRPWTYYYTHPDEPVAPVSVGDDRYLEIDFTTQWTGSDVQYFTEGQTIYFGLKYYHSLQMTWADSDDTWNKASFIDYTWSGNTTFHYFYEPVPLPPIPEPATLLLFATGLFGLGGWRRFGKS